MINNLTGHPFAFSDRVLHVLTDQKAEVQRIAATTGVKVEWFTGASAIQMYSDTTEPDFRSPSTWILVTHTTEDAEAIQAALDLE